MTRIAMIWAEAANGVIGTGDGMSWHVPADFRHFKETTLGAPVIMGRASWDALGRKALPGRHNIVITRSRDLHADDASIVNSLAAALALVQDEEVAWIAGGGQIYRQAMEYADELVVSRLDMEAHGDVTAPPIDPTRWVIDPTRTDTDWRPQSGDARWRVTTYIRPSESSK